nr:hypothetical protein [Micromonospora provocatoris]
MTQDATADDYAARVSGYREELAALRAGGHPTGGVTAEAHGRAADGQVEVAAEDGRLRSVELAAPLMRLSEDELGRLVEQAVNDALTASRGSLASSEPAPDLTALAGSLGAVLAESESRCAVCTARSPRPSPRPVRRPGSAATSRRTGRRTSCTRSWTCWARQPAGRRPPTAGPSGGAGPTTPGPCARRSTALLG